MASGTNVSDGPREHFKLGIAEDTWIAMVSDFPMVRIVKTLADYVKTNMKCSIEFVIGSERYSQDVNGTGNWSGPLGMIQRKEVDFYMIPKRMRPEYLEVIQYSPIAIEVNMVMISKYKFRGSTVTEDILDATLKGNDLKVLLAFFLLIVASSLVWFLHDLSLRHTLATFRSFFSKYLCFFLSQTVCHLTVHLEEKNVDSARDIYENPKYCALILDWITLDGYFESGATEEIRLLASKICDDDDLEYTMMCGGTKFVDSALQKNYVGIQSAEMAAFCADIYCEKASGQGSLYISKNPVLEMLLSFFVSRTITREKFDIITFLLEQLMESGIKDYMRQQMFLELPDCLVFGNKMISDDNIVEVQNLKIEIFRKSFLIWGCGIILSTVTFLVEHAAGRIARLDLKGIK